MPDWGGGGAVIFIAVAVTLAAGAIAIALTRPDDRRAPDMPRLLAAPPNTCTQTYTGGRTPATMLPLRNDNGVFVVPLVLGGHHIRAVVDTGSENLLVADLTCSGCDMGQGGYDGRSGEALDHSPLTLRFGTQRDTAVFHVDELLFVGVNAHQCDIHRTAFEPVLRIPSVRFARVTRRSGESNYNILGLCCAETNSLINQLTEHPHQQFTIYMHPSNGWLGFGDSDAIRRCVGAPDPAYLRLIEPPGDMPFAFYVSAIESVRVGDHRLPAPRYLLWDTGSNFSGCGPRTLDRMRDAGVSLGGPPIVMVLRTVSGLALTLTITSDTYCWSNGTLLIESHAPFSSPALNEDVFVLGSLFIQTYVLEFDLSNRRVGVSVVPPR